MPGRVHDAAYLHNRAEETRRLVDLIDDPVAKQAMLTIAENYELLAKRAEQRRGAQADG
jgi:hypothetical protein